MALTVDKVSEEWWRGAVIYQIYPRSFADSNNDGVGDLKGITQKLDYLSDLGVDGIWISPFFTSPMKDFGYDVSDYRGIEPVFGGFDDFQALIKKAHSLGLKVIIDQVISHTSDQHEWFKASSQDRTNAKADWYVWADASPDGTPPNNWLSVFGGSAWEWSPVRRQFYLHNFLSSQPDLNFHQPEVVDQVLEDLKFWLELGVDGFRLDTVNFYYHDKALRNNPPRKHADTASTDISNDANLYIMQEHQFDKSRPENIGFLKKLRNLLDQYPEKTSVGEIGADDALKLLAEYTQGKDRLHMAYTFDLLANDFGASYIRSVVEQVESSIEDGWPCWAMSNHDVERVASRWAKQGHHDRLVKLLMSLLLSLRGSVCIYQGEELGLPEAEVPFENLQDPYGIAFWPAFKGRDGCRTPMPWQKDAPHAGFTDNKPWLPVPALHKNLAVDCQLGNETSVLEFTRRMLDWRKSRPALLYGAIEFLPSSKDVLVFKRTVDSEVLLLLFNLSDSQKTVKIPRSEGLIPDAKGSVDLAAFEGKWCSAESSEWQRFF